MMKFIVGFIVIVLVVGGGYFILQDEQEDALETNEDAMMEDDAMEHDDSMMEEGAMKEDDAMMEDDGSMMEGGDAMMEDGDSMMEANTVSVDVSGRNFAFSETEIRVKKGDTVTINFVSADGFHDWVVDEFDASTQRVSTGGEASVTFVADTTGTFEYYCSVGNHRERGMVGNLIVE